MRDEALNAERIINEVLEEVGEFENCEIIVVDSNSLDNTSEIAEQTLAYSGVDGSRWKIVSAERSGKSHAVNLAMGNCNSEVIVMIDADVSPSPGWLEKFQISLSRENIGVVSGVEIKNEKGNTGPRSYYRSYSNVFEH